MPMLLLMLLLMLLMMLMSLPKIIEGGNSESMLHTESIDGRQT